MRARALILDFDGVMTDSDTSTEQVWRALFGWYGSVAGVEFFDAHVGEWSVPDLHAGLASVAKRPIASSFDSEWALVWSTLVWNNLPPRPEALDLLRSAKAAGWRTAIATNAQSWYVERHLSAWGAADLVDVIEAVIGSQMAKKPAPDVYLAAARALAVDPSDAVAIDDSDDGVRAAVAAGMRCFGLGTRWRSDTFEDAAGVVASLSEVGALVGLPAGS